MTSFTAVTARLSSLQLALVLLAVLAGVAIEHLSAAGSLSNHPVNPGCRSC